MDAASARELFDANARSYDRVNTVISLGLDSRWRAWAVEQATSLPNARVLDAFAGAGEVGLKVAAAGATVTLADVSPQMLEIARARAAQRALDVATVEADLTRPDLSLTGAPFDVVTAMWGLRYVDDPVSVVGGLARQLTGDGRLVLVDFIEPEPGPVSSLAALYFFHLLPRFASFLARRGELYEQLTSTTHRIGRAENVRQIVQDAGLRIAESRTMGFGLVLGLVAMR